MPKRRYNKQTKTIRFSKKIMFVSFAMLVLYTFASFWLAYRSNTVFDSQLTICVFTFLGTECFANAWIKVVEIKYKDNKEQGGTSV